MSTRANTLKIEAAHPAAAADMLHALIEANQAHARAIEAVKMRLELEAAQAREREVEQAALLGEARRELAEKTTALGNEKVKREKAERSLAEHEAFAAIVRAALPPTATVVTAKRVEAMPSPAMDLTDHPSLAEAESTATAGPVDAHVPSDAPWSSDDQVVSGSIVAGDAAVEPLPRPMRVAIELSGNERETLARVAQLRGIDPDTWVAELVRRELHAIASAADGLLYPESRGDLGGGG